MHSPCSPQRPWRLGALLVSLLIAAAPAWGQALDFTATRAEVDFGNKVRDWDGFGFNYVETAQTRDYKNSPQEYGGFSRLKEEDRRKIVDLVFGEDGLKVGLLKMFLDPFHQTEAGGKFDHETTTAYMRYFAREGLKLTRSRGADLTVITTLYGPPAYTTKQKEIRGRDLDPAHERDVAIYMVDWVKFLREREGLPVKYVSLHNEGEDWHRWTREGHTDFAGHDYNMFFPPELVVSLIKTTARELRAAGLADVGVTPGENTNWYRFSAWGYASAIAADAQALKDMALVTSHGFYSGKYGRWFGEHQSVGIDLLREKRPELKSWVTSTSWSGMDTKFVKEMHGNIYTSKVNGIIPWAGIQTLTWVGGDPNPGCAIRVNENGTYEVRRGYYFYKQISRAGQPGMAIVRTMAMDSEVAVIGFAKNGTKHPDAFIVTNMHANPVKIAVAVKGSAAKSFRAFRTTEDEKDLYRDVGTSRLENGLLVFEAPAASTTTFFAE